ncbi:MAG: SCP2 sterol-binding domain-containing protein [Deltaproteobacteria bacterium]|nr:SCP2 sterol-binding domain-containing protein [Deltaproteobacteria bacterium]
MAADIKKLFGEDLPAAMAKSPDAAKAIGAKFQMNITGEGGGSWFIDCSSSGPKIEAGTGEADCTIEISTTDFQTLLSSPQAGVQLFFAGKLKVKGDQMLALKLQKLFELK